MTHAVSPSRPVRVLIADDLARVRRELATLLALSDGIEIAGEAANGAEAVKMALTLKPDVVLMDLEMPVMDGFRAAAEIKKESPACRVIALTVYGGETERQKALEAGCNAFLLKGTPLGDLIRAICNSTNNNKEGGST